MTASRSAGARTQACARVRGVTAMGEKSCVRCGQPTSEGIRDMSRFHCIICEGCGKYLSLVNSLTGDGSFRYAQPEGEKP